MAGQAIHNITNADIAYAQAGIVTDVRMEMRERERERERGVGERERERYGWLVLGFLRRSTASGHLRTKIKTDGRTDRQTDRQTTQTCRLTICRKAFLMSCIQGSLTVFLKP